MPAPLESLDPLAHDVWRYGLGDGWRDLDAVHARMARRGGLPPLFLPPPVLSAALARLVAAEWAERAVPGWRRKQQRQGTLVP